LHDKREVSELFLSVFIDILSWKVVCVVSLEDALFVFSTSANTVVLTHDLSKLVEVLKDVDAYPSVEASRLE